LVCSAITQCKVTNSQESYQESYSGGTLKTWVSTTGARAVEIAWRIAFQRRPGGLATFDLGYHGRSIASSYVSDTAQQDCLMAGTSVPIRFQIPFPRLKPDTHKSLQEVCEQSLEVFRELLRKKAPQISALLVEPAIGSRGYYFAPAEYFQKLVSLAREYGLLIISDEVQMGLGRLGAFIASHLQGWEPDLLILGKALGGGLLPISCVVGRSEVLDSLPPGLESETFAGSPLSCRIAIEVLRILRETDVIQESSRLHANLRTALASKLPSNSVIGVGSATAIDLRYATANLAAKDLISDGNSHVEKGAKAAYRMAGLLREKRVLVHVTGGLRDRIAIIPPLNIGSEEMRMVEDACLYAWDRVVEDMFLDTF